MWEAVDQLLEQGVKSGAFPGCAMAAGQGNRALFTSVQGCLSREDGREVRHTTRYDIGALTRVTATMPLLLYALENGVVSLDDPISLYLDGVPEDKRDITLLSLLTGTSGLAPHFLLPQEADSDRDALAALLRHPLAGSVGGKVRDSSMGYILLGFALERALRMTLDEAVKRFVCAPLHMRDTGYLPSGESVAPSGAQDGSEAGYPSDPNARFLHGVAGHAGLFSTLEDMTRYAAMLAADGRTDDGVAFAYRSIHLATTDRTRGMNEARGYGFRIVKRSDPFLGHLWPSDGYGLQDAASGSLVAVSPEEGFFVTFLTNGFGTPQQRRDMERFHKLLLNAAYAAFQHEEN